ncbi:hypothetical protein NBRC3299_0231 [Acetobacter pasteurianus NBRC 3299]|nr:hypothetical protein BBA71_01970 [Acetobacter pasteurianus]GCD73939.1 hypothetical protein NBRC3299_0231 [Acetobacter pasteurianus NBRC 3299]
MTDKPTGVFVRLPLSDAQVLELLDAYTGDKKTTNPKMEDALLAIGTPVTGGELDASRECFERFYAQMCAKATGCAGVTPDCVRGLRSGDSYGGRAFLNNIWEAWPDFVDYALAKLAERGAEIARLEAKQSLYDRIVTENGELKRAVARLQRPEFYGTESQDIGSDDISSLFNFCKDNEVIEINGYRCVSTQFGFFDGTDVHLYGSEDEALSAAKALKGPEE